MGIVKLQGSDQKWVRLCFLSRMVLIPAKYSIWHNPPLFPVIGAPKIITVSDQEFKVCLALSLSPATWPSSDK